MLGGIAPSTNNLDSAQNLLQTTLQRLGSGRRINSAKDDAAGLAIAEAMTAQLGGTDQASRNVYDGLSLTETVDGALSQVDESLQRMRELSVQAANGSNSASDRQAIQDEINQLGEGITQLAAGTQFNGQNLLDGSFSGSFQTGANPGDTTALNLGDASSQGLGVAGLDVSTPGNATNALSTIDTAIASVQTMRSNIGAAQAGLNSTLANLSNTYENLASSRSRIADTDYAQETSNQSQGLVRQQAAIKALALYNANQSSVLNLLRA